MGSSLKFILVRKFVVENHPVPLLPLLSLLGWQLYQKMERGKFGTLMVSFLYCSELYVANERITFRGE